MHFWTIRLSYLSPQSSDGRRRFRENAQLGIVAQSIEDAIAAAKVHGVPAGGENPIVWGANHHGPVTLVVK